MLLYQAPWLFHTWSMVMYVLIHTYAYLDMYVVYLLLTLHNMVNGNLRIFGHVCTYAICNALVPSTLALSYLVM